MSAPVVQQSAPQLPQPVAEDAPYDFDLLNQELDRIQSQVFVGSNAAFLAPLMCNMDFVWSDQVQTAATDGLTIWWNPKDFLKLDHDNRISCLLHELWHPGSLHFVRRGDRDAEDWNIAGDIEINNALQKDGYKMDPKEFIIDSRFGTQGAEKIYEVVHKERQCAPRGPGGAQGQPQAGQGAPQPGHGGTNPSDMIYTASPEKQQQIINNVIQAANTAHIMGQPGAIPGHVQEAINKILNPKVPWEKYISRWLTEKSMDDFDWSMPERRYPDIYLPSLGDESRLEHLAFYFDVSGSITQTIAECCFSEIHHLKKQFNPEKLTVIQFDTRITSIDTYGEEDPFKEIVIVGRGGTCLKEVRDHMIETKPTCAVVFSDLFVEPMAPGPKNPILWIAVDNKQAKVPFGQLIHIKP